ncbi:MAG: hypothetical protein GEV12_14960 [Micromonosporaceae bacterium]|nr:hypothetical protein [Micromonosporaceae bacterium]
MSSLRSRTAPDAGRVSVFIAVAIIGVVAAFGAAVDATGQLRTLMRADNIAAEAARAAGQGIDIDAVAEGGQHRVSQARAAQYASEYLATAGHDLPGSAWSVAPSSDGTAVDITVQLTYELRILGMFGVPDPRVTGTSTAVLVTGT